MHVRLALGGIAAMGCHDDCPEDARVYDRTRQGEPLTRTQCHVSPRRRWGPGPAAPAFVGLRMPFSDPLLEHVPMPNHHHAIVWIDHEPATVVCFHQHMRARNRA